jgi:hypothetical protein
MIDCESLLYPIQCVENKYFSLFCIKKKKEKKKKSFVTLALANHLLRREHGDDGGPHQPVSVLRAEAGI